MDCQLYDRPRVVPKVQGISGLVYMDTPGEYLYTTTRSCYRCSKIGPLGKGDSFAEAYADSTIQAQGEFWFKRGPSLMLCADCWRGLMDKPGG